MTHGDDTGLICPPRLAQYQAVIVPIYKTDEERAKVLEAADRVKADLQKAGYRLHIDVRDGLKPGAKYYEWEARGVPLRLEIGPRDVGNGVATLARRTGGPKEPLPFNGLVSRFGEEIDKMQQVSSRRPGASRGEQPACAENKQDSSTSSRQRRIRLRRLVRRSGGRGGDQGADEGHHPRAAGRGVPDARRADDVHLDRRPATIEAVWAKAY
jgi:prolyl-tRNA synthetase